MKYMKKISLLLCLLLIFCVAFVSMISYGEENDRVEVSYDVIQDSKPEYEVKMEIPIFTNIKDNFFQLKLNHALKKEAKDKRTAFITDAIKAAKELEDNGQAIRQHQLFEQSQLKRNRGLVSLYTETYIFQGGAHGNTTINTLNFLNSDKVKLLTFQDIFKENTDYQNFINERIKKEIQIRKDKGISYFEGEEGFQSVTEDQSFYFDNDSLVILFDQYSIAPGYVGIPTFTISIEEIGEFLTEDVRKALYKTKEE